MASDYKNYAEALFELAKEEGSLEEVFEEISVLDEIFSENKEYFKIFSSPAVSSDEKNSLIDKAFSGCNPTLVKFLKYLASFGALSVFPQIKKDFSDFYYEEIGVVCAEVKSAKALTEDELNRLKEKLEAKTKKKVLLKNEVSPELLGGAVLRYSGKELDGSVKSKLDLLKRSFS